MSGTATVYISHAREDETRCGALLALLADWGVGYVFAAHVQQPGTGPLLSERAQHAIAGSAILLRICTRATRHSYWMSLETGAFLGLVAEDVRAGRTGRRVVNLILDPAYVREPFDRAATIVDGTTRSPAIWLNQLRQAIDLPPSNNLPAAPIWQAPRRRTISRREALGAGIVAVGLAAAGATGMVVLTRGRTPPRVLAPVGLDPHLLWRFRTGDAVVATPLVAGGTLFIGSNDYSLYALDATTGMPRWTLATTTPISVTPTLADGVLYLYAAASLGTPTTTIQGTPAAGTHLASGIFALDPATGNRLGEWDTPGAATSSATVAGGMLYLGVWADLSDAQPQTFVAYDAATGTQRWAFATLGFVRTTPAVVGGLVYFGCDDHAVYALDTTTGAPRWRFATGGRIFSSPTVAAGVVYIGSDDGNLYALDALTGAARWQYQTAGSVSSTPAVADGLVYAGSQDGSLFALDAATGAPRWRVTLGTPLFSSPAIAAGVVYCGANDHLIHAHDASTGAPMRVYRTDAAVAAAPVVVNGVLYAGSYDHDVYAFRAI